MRLFSWYILALNFTHAICSACDYPKDNVSTAEYQVIKNFHALSFFSMLLDIISINCFIYVASKSELTYFQTKIGMPSSTSSPFDVVITFDAETTIVRSYQ